MMFNNFVGMGNLAFWHHVHWIFILSLLTGLIMFVGWALKNLKGKRLGNWAVTLIVIGVLGMLLTSSFGGFGYGRSSGFGFGMMGSGIADCTEDEECYKLMKEWMNFEK